MKIQNKLTIYFLLALMIFAYILAWSGTESYRHEVMKLNARVCAVELERLRDNIQEQDDYYHDGIYRTRSEAQNIIIEKILKSYIGDTTPESYPLIISGDGILIAHPELSEGSVFPGSNKVFYQMLEKGNGEIYFTYRSQLRVVYFDTYKPWNWIVGYSQPVDINFRTALLEAHFRQVMIVLIGIIAFAALFPWLIRRTLSPLNLLVRETTAMASGEFPETTATRAAADEIGILSNAFNEMRREVRKTLRELQNEVAERIQKEKDIRNIIDHSPLAMAILNQGRTFYVNNMFIELFGYQQDELKDIDDWFCKVYLDQNSGTAVAEWQAFLNGNNRVDSKKNLRVSRKDGKKLEIEVLHKLINNRELVIFNDLTERNRTEQELKNTRNYLNQVFNSLNMLLVTVDQNAVISQWNRAMENFSGVVSENAVGQKLWRVAPFLKNYRSTIEQTIAAMKPVELYRETIIYDKIRHFNISIMPLFRHEEDGAVIILEDITELVKRTEQLLQAQKMETVGNLAGGLAHDFNNVLGGIKMALSSIRFYARETPVNLAEIVEVTALAEKSVNRSARLIGQLMTLARKSTLKFEAVDLNNAVTNVLEICHNTFDKSVELKLLQASVPALVYADSNQIEQVLLNLCLNAEQAMISMREKEERRGGQLKIEIMPADPHGQLSRFIQENDQSDNYWQINVSDTGVGIAPENLSKIFDPFFTTKPRGKGTGLGLSMAYNILRQHNGFIDVKSKLNEGSIFRIFLPSLKKDIAVTKESAAEIDDNLTGSGTILVVDDEEILRITIHKILESFGYKVMTAPDGAAACEIFQERHQDIDLVILDMVMPKKSGQKTFTAMRQINPSVKVLITSGNIHDERVKETIEAGAEGIIEKPFSAKELGRKVKVILSVPPRKAAPHEPS